MTWVLLVAAAVVVVAVVVAVVRRRRARHSDGVANFRRQIDALSPEARRPVVDSVHRLEEEAAAPDDEAGESDVADGTGDAGDSGER